MKWRGINLKGDAEWNARRTLGEAGADEGVARERGGGGEEEAVLLEGAVGGGEVRLELKGWQAEGGDADGGQLVDLDAVAVPIRGEIGRGAMRAGERDQDTSRTLGRAEGTSHPHRKAHKEGDRPIESHTHTHRTAVYVPSRSIGGDGGDEAVVTRPGQRHVRRHHEAVAARQGAHAQHSHQQTQHADGWRY